MPSPFLEIIELDDGRIALRRSDDDAEPLVVIEFSHEAQDFLQGQHVEVAKVMISSGMQMVGQIMDGEQSVPEGRVLH
ncbi:MAG: hypothetical protein WAV92_07715 [Halopseudomonas yangmingensis]|uniref:Uncharacterized protein n=1 Tax=Halopseudomonas yangmingensis TaxID=1720063 RepID=A0A1I4Q9N6_9GAMM|nr:hypothetical protein [Halopseudomonas yangmingensis]SFM36767.1 hypothetical protein SAMN05216217_10437 [Halopseudomonas yangmingensis]